MYPPPGGCQVLAPQGPQLSSQMFAPPQGPQLYGQPNQQQQAQPDNQARQQPDPRKVPITTASIPLFKIPKKHMCKIIEHIDSRLDGAVLGQRAQMTCAILIWLLTRIKPTTGIHDFNKAYYDELNDLFKTKSARVKKNDESAYNSMVDALVNSDCCDHVVQQLAIDHGFDPEMVKVDKKLAKQDDMDRMSNLVFMKKRIKWSSTPEPPQTFGRTLGGSSGEPARTFAEYMDSLGTLRRQDRGTMCK